MSHFGLYGAVMSRIIFAAVDKLRISIADTQYLMRKGLRQVVESQRPEYTIAREVDDEAGLLAHLQEDPPDVLILDYNQPRHFSPETIVKVREIAPAVGLFIITADDQKQRIFDVLNSGVSCFITKECGEDEILDGIEAARLGGKFFCNKVLDFLLERTNGTPADCSPAPLSPREREIVILTARGLIAKEIAAELNLSTHTVYTHKKNIMKKLRFSSPVQLAVYAIEHGMLEEN